MTDLPTPEQPDIQYAPKTARIFEGMPTYLKEIRNYDKVRRTIIEALAGKCSHSEIMDWAACPECQRRFAERSTVLKKLGFRSRAQYMAWQKVMEEIKTKLPPDVYKKMQHG